MEKPEPTPAPVAAELPAPRKVLVALGCPGLPLSLMGPREPQLLPSLGAPLGVSLDPTAASLVPAAPPASEVAQALRALEATAAPQGSLHLSWPSSASALSYL